jgi:hypothetical protein
MLVGVPDMREFVFNTAILTLSSRLVVVHTSLLLDIGWATNATQATKLLSAGSPLRTCELLQHLLSVRNKSVYLYRGRS